MHVRKPFDDLLHGRALGRVCEFTAHSSYHYGRRQASGIGLGGTVPARQHSSISVTNASGNLAFQTSKWNKGKPGFKLPTMRRRTCSTSSVESLAFCVTTFATTCARQRARVLVRARSVLRAWSCAQTEPQSEGSVAGAGPSGTAHTAINPRPCHGCIRVAISHMKTANAKTSDLIVTRTSCASDASATAHAAAAAVPSRYPPRAARAT